MQGQLASAIVNGTQLITGSGPKVTSSGVGSWWIDYNEMKPKANEAYYKHRVEERTLAPTGLDTTYSWSSSGRGDCYSLYWRGSASVGVTLASGVTTSHNGIGVLSTAALVKSGQITWSQSTLVQNGEGGSGSGTWKVVHKDRCRVCKDEVDIHVHQRLCYGCLEWYECYKHPGDHIEVSCPQNGSGQYCAYSSYYKCSPHTHAYVSSSASASCANDPDNDWCDDEGSCSTRSTSGVPGECGHNYCCCSPSAPLYNGGTSGNSGSSDSTPDCSYCTEGCSSCDDDESSSPTLVDCWRPLCSDLVSDAYAHQVTCSHCGDSYWTCGTYAYRHTDVATCRSPGCGVSFYKCSNGACSSDWGERDSHWASD